MWDAGCLRCNEHTQVEPCVFKSWRHELASSREIRVTVARSLGMIGDSIANTSPQQALATPRAPHTCPCDEDTEMHTSCCLGQSDSLVPLQWPGPGPDRCFSFVPPSDINARILPSQILRVVTLSFHSYVGLQGRMHTYLLWAFCTRQCMRDELQQSRSRRQLV